MKTIKILFIIAGLILAAFPFSTYNATLCPYSTENLLRQNLSNVRACQTKQDQSPINSYFFLNLGQLREPEVVLYGNGVYFTSSAVFFRVIELVEPRPIISFREQGEPGMAVADRAAVFQIIFLGANEVVPKGSCEQLIRSNFFLGNDRSRWVTDVPCYGEIEYENLYDGIDLIYRAAWNGIKYEFMVHPGAHLSDIRLRYEGADLSTDGESLFIETPAGTILDEGLILFEENENGTRAVKGRMSVHDNIVSYSADYDISSTLIIDPLIYSSYLGGALDDEGRAVAVDSSGNIIIAGSTTSLDFPTTPGAINASESGDYDIFVSKLNSNCSDLIFSTYIGGISDDVCYAMEMNPIGDIFLTGYTNSPDFPVSAGAVCQTWNLCDVFVIRLDGTGSNIKYSTYIGGNNTDMAYSIAVNSNDEAYLTGSTYSPDFPTTADAYWSKKIDIGLDVFVLILNSAGSRIQYSTFIGGTNNDIGTSIALGSAGSVYVCGNTMSNNFPVTSSAYCKTKNLYYDGFVLKLNSSRKLLDYSTFIGGDDRDWATSLAIDSMGNASIAGETQSIDFPVTPGAFDETYNYVNVSHRTADSFILRLNSTGSGLLYSTFIGGMGGNDQINQLKLSNDGSVITCGQTLSSDFPVTPDSYQSSLEGGRDAFVLRLSPDGSHLLYSSHLGSYCLANSLACPTLNRTYLTGMTYSYEFPVTPGAYDTTYNNGTDAFVTVLSIVPPPTPPQNLSAAEGFQYVQLNWWPPADCGEAPVVNYTVYRGPSATTLKPYRALGNLTGYNDSEVENRAEYYYAVAAFNSMLWSDLSNIVKAVPGAPPGQPGNLSAIPGDGFVQLRWEPPVFNGGFPVTAYRIYRGESPSNLSRLVQIISSDYRDLSLPYGSRYYYAASAVNAKGEGPISEIVSAWSGAIPSPPLNLSGDVDGKWVLLNWTLPTDDGGMPLVSYRIYKQDASGNYSLAAEINSTELSWQDGPYLLSETISYYVTAVNGIGESDPSESVIVDSNSIPGPPRELIASLGNRTVQLSWRPSPSDGRLPVLRYIIYRGELQDSMELLNSTTDDSTNYIDSQVERGRRYFYCVSAVNVIGEGLCSGGVSISTDGQPPVLSVNSPANGSYVNRTEIIVSGNSFDDFGLDIIELSIDGTSWNSCNGTSNWSAALDLPEGNHLIQIRARDVWGNDNSTQLYVKVDITKPAIRIVRPTKGEVVVSKRVEVTGWASDNMELQEIQIGKDGRNWSAAPGKSNWTGSLELSLGLNSIFARAKDAAGNTNQTEETVFVDNAAPIVNILKPANGHKFRSSGSPLTVEIRGIASDDTGVVQVEYNLDGKGWVSTKGNSSWSGSLKLDPGTHIVYVRATDPAGKTGYDNVTVMVEIPISVEEGWPLLMGAAIVALAVGALAWKKLRRLREGRTKGD